MIYAKKKDLSRYLGISPSLDAVIHFILEGDLAGLPLGRTEILGQDAFVNRFDYTTTAPEEAAWEGHLRYGDVHVPLCGHEKIGVSHIDALTETERREQDDFVGFSGAVENWFSVTPEDALVVFPEDIHMVHVADPAPCKVSKCCFKFRV